LEQEVLANLDVDPLDAMFPEGDYSEDLQPLVGSVSVVAVLVAVGMAARAALAAVVVVTVENDLEDLK
jgi:hypothetical protein